MTYAFRQYGTSTANLDARVAIHEHGIASWPAFVAEQLRLAAHETHLDVGAGTGLHWRDSERGRSVLADRHAPMCRALREQGHTKVLQCSADALPLAAGSFDVVTCLHVLYHVDDLGRAMDELVRVLAPGGRLAVSTNGPAHLRELWELASDVGVGRESPPHLRFSIDDAERVLLERGLHVRVLPFADELRVPHSEPVVRYLASGGDDLTAEQETALVRVINDAVAAHGFFRVQKETALVLASG